MSSIDFLEVKHSPWNFSLPMGLDVNSDSPLSMMIKSRRLQAFD